MYVCILTCDMFGKYFVGPFNISKINQRVVWLHALTDAYENT